MTLDEQRRAVEAFVALHRWDAFERFEDARRRGVLQLVLEAALRTP